MTRSKCVCLMTPMLPRLESNVHRTSAAFDCLSGCWVVRRRACGCWDCGCCCPSCRCSPRNRCYLSRLGHRCSQLLHKPDLHAYNPTATTPSTYIPAVKPRMAYTLQQQQQISCSSAGLLGRLSDAGSNQCSCLRRRPTSTFFLSFAAVRAHIDVRPRGAGRGAGADAWSDGVRGWFLGRRPPSPVEIPADSGDEDGPVAARMCRQWVPTGACHG